MTEKYNNLILSFRACSDDVNMLASRTETLFYVACRLPLLKGECGTDSMLRLLMF